MKCLKIFMSAILLFSCELNKSKTEEVIQIDLLLAEWHLNATKANLDAYIGFMDKNAIYIGTDATEIWNKKEFYTFCKPYFEKNKTWNFTTLKRNIQINKEGNTAWFNEVLNTQMGVCRGSGTLLRKDNNWKLQQYVLSVAVPNDDMNKVIQIKKMNDSIYLRNLK